MRPNGFITVTPPDAPPALVRADYIVAILPGREAAALIEEDGE